MKKYLLFFVSLICAQVLLAQTKAEKIEELLLNYNKLGRFNGSVLVAENNQVIWQHGYGYQNAATNRMNDEFTVYQIGSVTKQFTAAIILKLQEQKKLAVTDKLSKYFPSFPNAGKITIRHLLSHTSGIFNYTDNPEFMSKEVTKPATQQKIMALFKDKPLDFAPGTKWNYSNSGYMLLGYIIEKVTRKPYEKVFREMILQPLGMTQSGFNFANLAVGNKAVGYSLLTEKSTLPAVIVDSSVSYAAGSLYSSVTDLFLWAEVLNRQDAIIKPASWRQAMTPILNKYGYGLGIDSLHGEKIIAHSGGIFGFNSNLLVAPAKGISIILISNVNTGDLEEITNKLMAIVTGKKYLMPDDQPAAIPLPADSLQQYVGEYELMPEFKVTMSVKDGALMAQPTGQPAYELVCEKENTFRIVGVEARVVFVKGDKGTVEKLTLYQGGRSMDGKKIK